MQIRTKRALLACVACVSFAGAASAVPTITVTPYLIVNAFGSPSYQQALTNQFNALYTGTTSYGTPGTPAYYQAQSNITRADLIVTNFNSWKGDATPVPEYGSAYAQELGTRGAFGLVVNGNGTQFSISQLSFNATDNLGYLNFSNAAGAYNYGNGYIGVEFGADGLFGTSDDVFVNGGANTQLVDALIGRGSGNAFAVTCGSDPVNDYGPCVNAATNQAYLDLAVTDPFPSTFTGTYSLLNASGTGTFNISPTAAVPEPASWAMMLTGFGLLGAMLRRGRRNATALA